MTSLRTRRLSLGLSQDRIARRAGVCQDVVCRVELGTWHLKDSTRQRVETALGLFECERAAVRLVNLLLWGKR
jgi:predicted transcriptional regulator